MSRFLPALLATLVLLGCQEATHPNVVTELREWEPDRVVAVVDGFPIGAGEFEHYWALHPELDKEEVLEALIARQAALSNHLASVDSAGPEVQHARKQTLAKLAIGDILDTLAAESAETEIKNAAYVAAYKELGHPRGYRVSHIVVMPKDLEKVDEMTDELQKHARELIAKLPADPNSYDLIDLVGSYEVPDDMVLALDLHLTTIATEMNQYDSPEGWKALDPDFVEGVEEMAERGETVSREPVNSRFGLHAVVLEQVIEEKEPDKDELREVALSFQLRSMAGERINEELLEKMRKADWWVSKKTLGPEDESQNQ